jgi:hypothetical protein
MRAIERVIGITIGTVFLAAGPALAAPVGHSPAVGWTTADAVAAQRMPGDILATRLKRDGGRALYTVDIQSVDRLEEVLVDAHNASVIGVHTVNDPGVVGEIEGP